MLNSSIWVEHLPKTVEAFFHLKGSNPSGDAVNNAHKAHLDFLQQYELTDEDVPLLELDLSQLHEPGPFKEIRNELLAGTQYTKTA